MNPPRNPPERPPCHPADGGAGRQIHVGLSDEARRLPPRVDDWLLLLLIHMPTLPRLALTIVFASIDVKGRAYRCVSFAAAAAAAAESILRHFPRGGGPVVYEM